MKKIKGFISDIFRKIYVSMYVGVFSFLSVNMAHAAPTFGDMADTISNQFTSFAKLVKFCGFLLGLYLALSGFSDLRQLREKQTTVAACLIKIGVGFALCSLPWIIEVGTSTMGGGSPELNEIL